MKTNSFSIVVGDNMCNAKCPYCVSKMTGKLVSVEPNWLRFEIACDIVDRASDGLVEVILTGKGEPTLHPGLITKYLNYLDSNRFPLITLQTNGSMLVKEKLVEWAKYGLTSVCISIGHVDGKKNTQLLGVPGDFWDSVKLCHEVGLSVRLSCIMFRGGVDSMSKAVALIRMCHERDVEQLTFRDVELYNNGSQEVVDWVVRHKLDVSSGLKNWLESYGTHLMDLPHGGSVYDYQGQNVCVTNCLTGSPSPERQRQIIYFPDGRIAYDWRYKGARIL